MTFALAAAVLGAAAVAALLWPEERKTAAGRARMVVFALLAGVVGHALAGRQAERVTAVATGRAFVAYTQGLIDARSFEASRWTSQGLAGRGGAQGAGSPRKGAPATRAPTSPPLASLRARALRSYADAVRLAPESALFRRQYAILLADAGRREEALGQFRAAGGGRGLWEQLYGARPPGAAELPALEGRVRRLHLGWFASLVWRSVYRRMGLTQRAAAMGARAGREAAWLNGLLGVIGLAMLGTAFLGLGLAFAGLLSWRRGYLRPVHAARRAGAAPLLEAFVLYLFLAVAPEFFPFIGRGVRGLAPERAVGVTVLLLLGSDLLSLVAVGYLWRRLRSLGLSLAEIGLHARELGQNVRFGLGGYAAALPLVIGSSLLATWLGHRYFPQVAPPFHPIEALMLAARASWVRLALLLIAAVGAPIFEEIFFRGLLYGALRRRFGVAGGIVASAALFASLHPQLPLGFLPIFVLGAVLAGLYEWRQSLVPGMVLHAVNNGVIWIYLNLLFPPG